MTFASSFNPKVLFSKFNKLRSIMPAVTCLIIVSFFLIGGCNDSGFNQTQEARTIGKIQGVIVPAVQAEYILERWQEGDPDGNIFLNGSRVSGLTQPEQDALNSAYQSGFFVSLIDPETQDMNDLIELLGLQQMIEDNRPVDLYAVSREFNVSGVRHYTMDSLEQLNEDNPPELSFYRERVQIFTKWAADQMTTATSARTDGSPSTDLTSLADSTTYSHQYSLPPNLLVLPEPTASLSDYYFHSTTTLQGWSVHSGDQNRDFYFFQLTNEFAPNTTLPRVQPGNLWPCNFQQPPKPPNGGVVCGTGELCPTYIADLNLRGSVSYEMNNLVANFNSGEVLNLQTEPKSTEGTVSTTSAISATVGGNVSFSSGDGAEIGVSNSVTYDQSQTYSAPSVSIMNESLSDSNGNNALWFFDLQGAPNIARSTFQPQGQWVLSADADTTRAGGFMEIVTGWRSAFYLITCATNPGVLGHLLNPTPGSLVGWNINFPVPPTPPPPTPMPTPMPTPTPPPPCTMGSCPVGQECATDLTPPVCVPQPCDESMVCPLGFECMNEVCEPES